MYNPQVSIEFALRIPDVTHGVNRITKLLRATILTKQIHLVSNS